MALSQQPSFTPLLENTLPPANDLLSECLGPGWPQHALARFGGPSSFYLFAIPHS